ncbi:hypothetical protein [Calothrix sp. NIES-2098]
MISILRFCDRDRAKSLCENLSLLDNATSTLKMDEELSLNSSI